jgi:hypothetical protein
VTESHLVSTVITVTVLSVRHALRSKEYLNTENVIKELKPLSCGAEEIVRHRTRTLEHQAYNSTDTMCSLKGTLLLCPYIMVARISYNLQFNIFVENGFPD